MSDPRRCDICRRAVVCWPRTLTVLGPMDLCGSCYWRYVRLVESIANYFNQNGRLPKESELPGERP
jgi:hypothetical protein